jgi:hypothetical protein
MNFRVAKIAFLLFLTLVTVSSIVTSIEAYLFIRAFRFVALVLLTIFFILYVRRLNSSLVLYFYLLAVYLASILIFGNSPIFIIDFLVVLLGIPIVSFVLRNYNKKDESQYITFLLFYFYLSVLLTFFLGGFNLENAVLYNFTYEAETLGQTSGYSLGISNIYGLFTIAFLYRFLSNDANKWLYAFSGFLAAALTLIGGGRGEIIVAVVIVFFVMAYWLPFGRQKKGPTILLLALAVIAYLGSSFTISDDYSLIINRFLLILDGDLSSRDILLFQGFELLSDNVSCLMFGCGLGFFQNYFGYDLSMYPHNFILEFIISFGFCTFIFVLVFLIRGLYKHYQLFGQPSLILIIFFHQSLISMKSGYVFGTHLLTVLIICLFSFGLTKAAKYE